MQPQVLEGLNKGIWLIRWSAITIFSSSLRRLSSQRGGDAHSIERQRQVDKHLIVCRTFQGETRMWQKRSGHMPLFLLIKRHTKRVEIPFQWRTHKYRLCVEELPELQHEVFFETRCCFRSRYFLHRENTMKALQLHNQKHKRRRSTGVFYMIGRKEGGKRQEGDFGFPVEDCLAYLSHCLSLFFSFCFHFSRSWFEVFSSSTVGCKREIVHHIPHILWW